METPYLPKTIFGRDFEYVYEPAEDTFLLLDALEKDLTRIKTQASVFLEIGSGSGIVSTAIAKALKETQKFILTTDINLKACKTTKKCATHHEQPEIQVICTRLAECLSHRLKNQVDVLVFNPPYVPTDSCETEMMQENQLNLAWAGGESGRQLVDQFLNSYVPNLLSRPSGVAYLVAIKENNIQELLDLLNEHKIKGSVVMQRRAGLESLHVIRYGWI